MIPLEKQVCSLELAKRLKELGVAQQSLYVWSDWFEEGKYGVTELPPATIRHTEIDGSYYDRTPDKISTFHRI